MNLAVPGVPHAVAFQLGAEVSELLAAPAELLLVMEDAVRRLDLRFETGDRVLGRDVELEFERATAD